MSLSALVCRRFGLSESEFASFIQTCPYRYKTYKIAKRNSGKKREISQPSKALKAIQRYIIGKHLGSSLTVHDAAKAYMPKLNITDNARPHLDNAYLLKMDFNNFFPSITAADFTSYLIRHQIADEREARILALLFFKVDALAELRLTIGSPGSPLISNALMFEFDQLVSSMCSKAKVAYTRYSDDLTFSTNEANLLFSWPAEIKKILKGLDTPRLSINDAKTVFSSKKHNRHVTGITITNDGGMSVGRSQKRHLRSQVYKVEELNAKAVTALRGHIAFVNQIEPGFIKKLRSKYPEQMLAAFGSSD